MKNECNVRGWIKEKIKTFITKIRRPSRWHTERRRPLWTIWPVWTPGSLSCGCPDSGRSGWTGRAPGCSPWTAPPPSRRWLSSTGYGTGRWTWTGTLEPEGQTDGDTVREGYASSRTINSPTMNKHWMGLWLIIQRKSIHKRNVSNFKACKRIPLIGIDHLTLNTSISAEILYNFLSLSREVTYWGFIRRHITPYQSFCYHFLLINPSRRSPDRAEGSVCDTLPSWLPGCGPVGRPQPSGPCTTSDIESALCRHKDGDNESQV